MTRVLLVLSLYLLTSSAYASIADYFKDELGRTKWQHVANFSGAVLITLLTITLVTLFFSYRNSRKANRELNEIRKDLEDRVRERTATLAQANEALEGEIGEHRETMARLQDSQGYIKSIVDSMPLMLIGLNEKMQITQWNTSSEKVTGAKREQVLGKNLWEAYPTITLSSEQVQEVLETKKTTTIKHSQRGQYYFDLTLYTLQSNSDVGIVIMLEDVTKRVKAENRLIELDKMASMGELAATMAIDVGTPLKTIMDNLQCMKASACNSLDKEEMNTCLAAAIEDGRQANAIVKNLVDFSLNQGGKLQLASIPEIMDHTIELASQVLSNPSGLKFRDVKLKKDYQEGISRVPCQTAELQQVFLGVFRHACHALGECDRDDFSPLITIEINEFYDAIWIKMIHNGKGLTAEEQQNIFEPFFLNSENQQSQGSGLQRLSFSHFVVTEHHHGHMAVTSDLDVGTTFHVQMQVR
ncbi:two-component system sensor histidine kinase NtrB [Teredinibacter haidensis]|uniref:two-component system sensor histidine kinase NtrB n=1 Tax=Teredinibacter haidensis TaxID=2731755 RepID=UPI000948DBEB|nr:ATP-binding protein [Teredinibacter haidensis]